MWVTLLAEEQPIARAELCFRFIERGQPASVIGIGPAELLPAFERVRPCLAPPQPPALPPFRVSGRSSAQGPASQPPGPALALDDLRGARLPTRSVRCLPSGTSPSGFDVVAILDEAAAPRGAFAWPQPWQSGGDVQWPEADV